MLKAGRWWRIQGLALPYMAQGWMNLSDFNHEFPRGINNRAMEVASVQPSPR
jgi:hypothetical protein